MNFACNRINVEFGDKLITKRIRCSSIMEKVTDEVKNEKSLGILHELEAEEKVEKGKINSCVKMKFVKFFKTETLATSSEV